MPTSSSIMTTSSSSSSAGALQPAPCEGAELPPDAEESTSRTNLLKVSYNEKLFVDRLHCNDYQKIHIQSGFVRQSIF